MTTKADRAVSGDGEPKANIFISYSRKDMAFADRLDAALIARGYKPLVDREEIYAFEDWWRRIEALITQADTIIFVLSPDAVSSDICQKEVAFAASLNKRFAPVVCKRVDNNAVPAPVRRFNYVYCDEEAQFEARMELLAEALSTDIDWIRKHSEFGALARKWEIAGRPGPKGLLLRSPALEEAERWLASRPPGAPEPTRITRAFIVESRRQELRARRRSKRQKISFAILVAGLVALGWLSYLGWLDSSYLKIQTRRLADIYVPTSLTPEAERGLIPGNSIKECASCPEMIVIPTGEFIMGSPEGEGRDDERPQRRIVIARPFAISMFEITFDQWDACVAHGGCTYQGKGESWGRGNQPINKISWNDANAYVAWISRQSGKPYRLVTEAEWEYVARAGSSTRYSFGNDEFSLTDYGWYGLNSNQRTQAVGMKKPNKFGIYDMHGNVWEWVQDCYLETYSNAPTDGSAVTSTDCTYRVLRGGSWFSKPEDLRSAARYGALSRFRADTYGFRIARTLSRD